MVGAGGQIGQSGGLFDMAWPMAMIVTSFLIYHAAMKAIRPDLHPLAFLAGVYVVSLLITLGLWMALPGLGPTGIRSGDIIWVVLLGIALIGIEFGFLMAYRNGWSVSVAPTFSNVTLALILAPVGLIFLQERLSWQNFLGLGLCVVGLVLMTKRPV